MVNNNYVETIIQDSTKMNTIANIYQPLRVAIVYDWIDSWGGVERVLLQFHQIWPHADFFTSYVDLQKAPWAKQLSITPSFIQNLPDMVKNSRIISLPLYPHAFESFDFSDYDLVISVSSAFAKSVITRPSTKHICYLLTPPRYLWGMTTEYSNSSRFAFISPFLRYLREFDYIAAQRPDDIISISCAVAERCKSYYRRISSVLYPPFDLDYWRSIKGQIDAKDRPISEKYYLIVSRLEPYKKVDMVINLFNKTGKKLVIIGKGTQKSSLMQKAKGHIQFIENITDNELATWYIGAEALIMAQEEDFGYVSLEAQCMGCPVVAYGRGGALETVKDRETGLFFALQSEESLEEALERLDSSAYNIRHALEVSDSFFETFRSDHFLKKLEIQLAKNL